MSRLAYIWKMIWRKYKDDTAVMFRNDAEGMKHE